MLANAVKDSTKISSTVNGREGILGKRPKTNLESMHMEALL